MSDKKQPPATTEEVMQYFWGNADSRNKYDPNENSINGAVSKTMLKIKTMIAEAKKFKNVFSNNVSI